MAYRRRNHNDLHVSGYNERANINTPFELAILNQIHRFSNAIAAIDRVPRIRVLGAHAKDKFRNEQIACCNYAFENGIDKPKIVEWKWPIDPEPANPKMSAN